MTAADDAVRGSGVLGGGMLTIDEYAGFIASEYLADYLPAGGSAVKVAVVGDPDGVGRLDTAMAAAAAVHDCVDVPLSAETTKLHMIQELFFAIARRIDWDNLAAASVRAAYDATSFAAAPGLGLGVAEVAGHYDVDSRELYRSVRRQLEQLLLEDPMLAPEMRRAMLRLAQVQLGAADVDAAEHQAVLDWLRGDLRSVMPVRPALIYTRIGRHNARALLVSLARLLLAAGRVGCCCG